MNTPEQLKAHRDKVVAAFPDSVLNPGEENPRIEIDLTGLLGFCGCGDPDGTARWLADFLKSIRDKDSAAGDELLLKAARETLEHPRSGPLVWLLFYWMEDRFYLEHGSTARYPWPDTDKEDKFEAMVSALEIEADAPEAYP